MEDFGNKSLDGFGVKMHSVISGSTFLLWNLKMHTYDEAVTFAKKIRGTKEHILLVECIEMFSNTLAPTDSIGYNFRSLFLQF